MLGDTLGDFVSSFSNDFIELYSSYSEVLISFALACCCCFSQLWSIIEDVKLGVSDNGQKSASRKTIRISLAAGARSVLEALWDLDDKVTMVFMKRSTNT